MCTSIVYQTKHTYFGRNLDLEYSNDETITITPRNFPLIFHSAAPLKSHFAIIGVAYVMPDQNGEEYPLYYDAINEKGLGMAGLNFQDNCVYFPAQPNKDNIASYEFIPWILSQCASVKEAKVLLGQLNLLGLDFNPELTATPLHWFIADSKESITVESTATGLNVYDNPVGVLTNNPPFPAQLFGLNNYMGLSSLNPKNTLAPGLKLWDYSRGLGTRNLPGGMDSESRFIKACFTKLHSISDVDELSSIGQFFHILESVNQSRGSDEVKPNDFEYTVYSTGYNLELGICYYTHYNNRQITAIDMHQIKLDSKKLKSYTMITTEQIYHQK